MSLRRCVEINASESDFDDEVASLVLDAEDEEDPQHFFDNLLGDCEDADAEGGAADDGAGEDQPEASFASLTADPSKGRQQPRPSKAVRVKTEGSESQPSGRSVGAASGVSSAASSGQQGLSVSGGGGRAPRSSASLASCELCHRQASEAHRKEEGQRLMRRRTVTRMLGWATEKDSDNRGHNTERYKAHSTWRVVVHEFVY